MQYINASTDERIGEIAMEFEVSTKSFISNDVKAAAQEDRAHAAKEEQHKNDWKNYYIQL